MRHTQAGYVYEKNGWWIVRYRQTVCKDGKLERIQRTKRLVQAVDRYKGRQRNGKMVVPDEVKELAKDELKPLNEAKYEPNKVMQLGPFVEKVYFPYVERQKHASTAVGYKEKWNNYLAPRCADLWMRDLRTCDVQGILNQIASQHDLSAATVQRCKSLLSGIFSHAKTQGYFDGINPVHETEIPANTHQSAETYAYSPEEINDMLRTLPNPAHAVIATASYAGLTKSEIEGMTWECYSGSELNVVRARVHGKFGEPKTKKRRGAVHVSPVLKGVLDKYRLACGNPVTGPMFVNAKGLALDLNNLANRVIGPILDEHGMQWHGYHACRRGLATRLHDQKVDDLTVRDVLRHGDVKTTIRSYIKVLPQAVIDAVNRQHDDLCTSCAPFASEKVSLPN